MATQTLLTQARNDQSMAKSKVRKTNDAKLDFGSLFMVILAPLCLTMTIVFLFGSGQKYRDLAKPFWFPPLAIIHIASVASTVLMGLAGWLVRNNGGFRLDSDALPLYVAQVSLSTIWNPLVLKIGAAKLGFVFSLVNLGTLLGCYWLFGKVNPSSKFFVKPCLAWAAYISLVTFKLICL